MNVLEHWIKEIKSVEPYDAEWTKEYDEKFVKVVVVVDCHGKVEERFSIETETQWSIIKERGYFML